MAREPDLDTLLDAALKHVAFDGWSAATTAAAAADAELSEAEAKALAPRGALDLVTALHRRGDMVLQERLAKTDLDSLRFRDRVATALKFRLDAMPDQQVARRTAAFLSVPIHAPEGAKLVWGTSDMIWNVLGDTSRDGNWYTKRATLSAVLGSTLLYWLGDESPDHAASNAFIDRRIDEVMQIESLKGKLRQNPLAKPFMDAQSALFRRFHAPNGQEGSGLPGRWESGA
ncbi:MAG: COQ9 family protein [Boseongicola sp. SB0676_bin_33]|uniref:COQ9 family protein n=1 Tax=Boseongicola sp. SB0664_bin_43 TaxID=2604844 RepID=A0A6B0Y061_9RHOB|nr:COQ9 family protein [Boseongicola sp. SB0664_bin_43]MYF89491.1 COQ9 family protein [Boseongicola sp. SB0676_bin_33]MYK30453.1 COQ9 family protein [Boseongicola sp. SB0670_bin_30]